MRSLVVGCLIVLASGCGESAAEDAGPPDAGAADAGAVDAGSETDAGESMSGDGLVRLRAASDRAADADCVCSFTAAGFETVAQCEEFDRLPEERSCEDSAFRGAAGSADAAFDCLADAFEDLADCIEAAACDETATTACYETLSTVTCPDLPRVYSDARQTCFDASVVGTTPSDCPENATASSATGDAVFVGTTVNAGDESSGSCGRNLGEGTPDRVFEWSAPAAGTYVIDTRTSRFDTALYVLDACSGGSELACNDDGGPTDAAKYSRVEVTLTDGETVFIVVDGFGSNAGDFQVNIHEAAPPMDGGVGMDAGVPDAG